MLHEYFMYGHVCLRLAEAAIMLPQLIAMQSIQR